MTEKIECWSKNTVLKRKKKSNAILYGMRGTEENKKIRKENLDDYCILRR